MSKPDLLRKITDEAATFHLRALVETCPDFDDGIDDEARRWLGKLAALVDEVLSVVDVAELRTATRMLKSNPAAYGDSIKRLLFSALAAAELSLPVHSQGSFVPAGNAFDAFAAIAKVLSRAQKDVLIVDPYMDHSVLEQFAVAADERTTIRLLADSHHVKASLQSAAQKWSVQHGGLRPLEVRTTPARTLHDRLIQIDGKEVWIATQSFAHFASRSPGALQQFDPASQRLKIDAYELLWEQAAPLT